MTIKPLFAMLLLLTSQINVAQAAKSTTSQHLFKTGTDAFNNGNYEAAVLAFRQAEKNGLTSPALHYNMASSYYMLEEFDLAIEYFQIVRRYEGMEQLADYNLGLIAQKQNDNEQAEKLFVSVAEKADDKKLKALAETKLKDIRFRRIPPKHVPTWVSKKWSAYISASLGYDDNVNFAPLGISSEISSRFSEVFATGDYLLSGDRRNGWSAEARLYGIKYFDINGPIKDLYDEYEISAGINNYLRLNDDWQSRYSLDFSEIYYGGEDYQDIINFRADARRTLSKDDYVKLRYSYEDINIENPLFDYLEGRRQQLRAEYRLYRDQGNSRLYYELELNDRNDLSVATGDFSYSPTRHTLRGRYTHYLSARWDLTGDLAYRISDYPATVNQNRLDKRYKVAGYTDYYLSKDIKLRAKIEYTDNLSNDDIFTYKRTIYTLGINALF